MISKVLVPNIENDMSRVMKREVDSVAALLSTACEPQAYGYLNAAGGASPSASTGAIRSSSLLASNTISSSANRVVKLEMPVHQMKKGLFY